MSAPFIARAAPVERRLHQHVHFRQYQVPDIGRCDISRGIPSDAELVFQEVVDTIERSHHGGSRNHQVRRHGPHYVSLLAKGVRIRLDAEPFGNGPASQHDHALASI